jgi:hypothetical protein
MTPLACNSGALYMVVLDRDSAVAHQEGLLKKLLAVLPSRRGTPDCHCQNVRRYFYFPSLLICQLPFQRSTLVCLCQ